MNRAMVLAVLMIGACGSADDTSNPAIIVPEMSSMVATEVPAAGAAIDYGERFPEVLAVDASDLGEGRWRFDVTLSSPYDAPQRYADAWRVDANDTELGIRVLLHDHANEQPFTRSETIEVPDGTSIVFVEGRDQANGWSGQRFELSLPTP